MHHGKNGGGKNLIKQKNVTFPEIGGCINFAEIGGNI